MQACIIYLTAIVKMCRISLLILVSKKIIQPSSVFPSLYCDFYRLLLVTSRDNWVPRMSLVFKISIMLTSEEWCQ